MGSATNHGLNLIGSGASAGYSAAHAQSKMLANNNAQAAQAKQAQYNAMMQQHQYGQQQQLMHAYNQAYAKKKWMLDGVEMDFDEFVNTIYPDDCPEKTYIILRLKGNE